MKWFDFLFDDAASRQQADDECFLLIFACLPHTNNNTHTHTHTHTNTRIHSHHHHHHSTFDSVYLGGG
jgi:hypothetical protein